MSLSTTVSGAEAETMATAPIALYDGITRLATLLCNKPLARLAVVDLQAGWLVKAAEGPEVSAWSGDHSFCQALIQQGCELVVENVATDGRCTGTALMREQGVVFYAGVPLRQHGRIVGTLSVMDRVPGRLTPEQLEGLHMLARQAEQLLFSYPSEEENSLRAGDARYKAIIQGAAAGIVRINGRGAILEANHFVQEMLGYNASELIGRNVKMLMPERWSRNHDGYLAAYQQTGTARVIGTGREVEALHRDGHSIPVHLAVSEVVADSADSREREFIGILSDLRDVHAARQHEERQKALLEVLHTGLTDYRALVSGNTLWEFLKEALRELTGSEYALIGEVVQQSGQATLKLHAISDLSWSEESRQLMQKLVSGDMMLTNPDSLLGRVFAGGEVVLHNRMEMDLREGGLPPGHPYLSRYLGVPILDRGQVIGMYAIANGGDEYDPELVRWLEPFTSTCALLINLYRQMNEQKRLNEELKQAHAKAEGASLAKTEFLSSMSHELRTPLNSILGFAQLLGNGRQPLNERQQRQIQQIIRSGRHLLSLINEVLDLARIEAGKMQVSIEPVRLADVLQEAVETLGPLADEASIRIKWLQSECCRLSVRADYTRLRQVLINLISNAIKYNRPGGQVLLECHSSRQVVRICVRDTGIGIPAHRFAELFQPFSRLDAEGGSIEGTGVGLALTRKLVRLMQGEIGVESIEGEGSVFWFELPLAERQRDTEAEGQPDAADIAIQGSLQQVLYIEDNPANQRLMIDLFEDLGGCELTCVASAEEGIERACSERPDLILMDIDLPGMSGFQAQQILQRNPLTAEVPVLAVSASASTRDIRRAREAGFVDYLTKPLDLTLFSQRVEEILNTGVQA